MIKTVLPLTTVEREVTVTRKDIVTEKSITLTLTGGGPYSATALASA